MQVEIWSDVVCPWCYLGKRRFENALAGFEHRDEVTVVQRSYQLDPSAPSDHTVLTLDLLAQKFGMSAEQAERVQQEMQDRAAADGLDYNLDGQRSGNTFTAHRLLQLAQERGVQDDLTERLFRAHFTDQVSVFDPDSLRGLAVAAGLDPAEVDDVLAGDRYTDAVDADIEQAREYGITGVPFFVLDGRLGVSGAQTAEVLSAALTQAYDAAR